MSTETAVTNGGEPVTVRKAESRSGTPIPVCHLHGHETAPAGWLFHCAKLPACPAPNPEISEPMPNITAEQITESLRVTYRGLKRAGLGEVAALVRVNEEAKRLTGARTGTLDQETLEWTFDEVSS